MSNQTLGRPAGRGTLAWVMCHARGQRLVHCKLGGIGVDAIGINEALIRCSWAQHGKLRVGCVPTEAAHVYNKIYNESSLALQAAGAAL
jgi:hypothetical protein